MTTPRGLLSGVRHWPLAKRIRVAFSIAGAIGVLVFGIAILAYRASATAKDMIIRQVDAAVVTNANLFNSLVDEETGVRGYALTGDERFLEPYTAARATQDAAFARLRAVLPRSARLSRELQALQDAAATWQRESAEPTIAVVRAGATGVATGLIDRGKARFDQVRTANDALTRSLTAERTRDIRHAAVLFRILIATFFIGVVLIAVSGYAIVVATKRSIIGPVARLGEQARRVGAGDFSAEISVDDPPDLAALAADVDRMRLRIVDDLNTVERARAELDRRAAELSRSNQDLEQFAYVASHDLQEPLRKVSSFCQLLEQRFGDKLDDRGHQYIEYAVDGAKRMQALINDLLAFSRVGRTTDGFVPVDLDDIAHRAADELARRSEDVGASITIGALPLVAGDPTLLAALFTNLIGNAVKYGREGVPPVVDVSARRDGEDWEITCRDNGIGIEPQFAERVFVIFQRLHGRDQYAGTGIGLALCRKIVEFHGGRIWIDTDDTESPGATIRFRLPAITAAAEPELPAEPAPDQLDRSADGEPISVTMEES